jgi:hypothetical protein
VDESDRRTDRRIGSIDARRASQSPETFHKFTTLSAPHDARTVPSGENFTPFTPSACPSRSMIGASSEDVRLTPLSRDDVVPFVEIAIAVDASFEPPPATFAFCATSASSASSISSAPASARVRLLPAIAPDVRGIVVEKNFSSGAARRGAREKIVRCGGSSSTSLQPSVHETTARQCSRRGVAMGKTHRAAQARLGPKKKASHSRVRVGRSPRRSSLSRARSRRRRLAS